MTRTGWIGSEPDAAGPALPVTNMLLGMRQRGPGDTVARALARSDADDTRAARDELAFAPDPDERAAGLVARGYTPGLVPQLAQRLADTVAEIEAENTRIERSARRQERIARDHAAGRITAFDIARMRAGDDEGDPAAVERLERRAAGLRRQIGEAQAAIAPQQQREADPVEAASRHAHQIFAEITRQRFAEAQAGTRRARPFAGRGGAAVRNEPVECEACIAVGASPEESFLIHHCDADGNLLSGSPDVPVPVPRDDDRRSATGFGRELTRSAARRTW
jgi:hypothetical protein